MPNKVKAVIDRGYRVYKDGNKWCAVGPGFINLEESNAGFAYTPTGALAALLEQELGLTPAPPEGGSERK